MINKVILVGNVGRDPEVRYLDNGVVVTKFPLATSETYTNKGGDRVTNTEWHNIVLWRKLAEVAEKWVKKGTPLYIEGKIRNRSYDDKDGNKRYITEIVGDNMQMLGRKSDDQSSSAGEQSSGQNGDTSYESNNKGKTSSDPFGVDSSPQGDDDLPF
ncbi:MAG: single-stranded DNA-binding protein [Bacteroidales bacterium]|nr:single-stranded DNA-binding protein [Bacteroidales bacterium]